MLLVVKRSVPVFERLHSLYQFLFIPAFLKVQQSSHQEILIFAIAVGTDFLS